MLTDEADQSFETADDILTDLKSRSFLLIEITMIVLTMTRILIQKLKTL
jgi:hypothetical protein